MKPEDIKKTEDGADETKAPVAKKGAKKEDTVEVSKDALAAILADLEKLKESNKDLVAAADMNRLARVQSLRNSGKLVKSAKISVYEGKYVLGWSTVKDDVYIDEQGRVHEDQSIQLVLDAGEGKDPIKSDPISYRTFSRITQKEEGEVVRDSKDENGQVFYTIQVKGGRKFELSIAFIN